MNTYYPNYFSTMRKKWLPISLISSLIIFPSLYYRHIQSNYEKEAIENELRLKAEQFIPPVFYDVGSAEYSLVANRTFPKEIYGNVGDEYSQVWVLRFSDLINCISSSSNYICESHDTDYILPRDRSSSPNESIASNDDLILFLEYPNFNFIEKRNGYYPSIIVNNSILNVYLSSENRPYKVSDEKRKRYKPYSYSRLQSFEQLCKVEREYSKNLFKVRNLTHAEKQARTPKNSYEYISECIFDTDKSVVLKNSSGDNLGRVSGGGDRKTDRYFYFNNSNLPLSDGTCAPNGKTYICSFDFWLPQSRIARIEFHGKWLDDFDRFYKDIVEFFNQSTVVEKSKNLTWQIEN